MYVYRISFNQSIILITNFDFLSISCCSLTLTAEDEQVAACDCQTDHSLHTAIDTMISKEYSNPFDTLCQA